MSEQDQINQEHEFTLSLLENGIDFISKGFELISNEQLRLNIINLYSVRYRVLDLQETSHPQFQGYEILFEFVKEHFKKSDKPNISCNFTELKNDQEFRFLLNQVLFWNQMKINFYEYTKKVVLQLQDDIEKEIN